MENILYKINNITEFYDLERIIRKCEERKKRLAEEKWDKLYADRCKEHYIPLEMVFMHFWTDNNLKDAHKLENHYYDNPHGLSSLLSQAKSLELEVPYCVGKMACSICTCGGCSGQIECCGYTCEECKPHYTGYQWVCEE